MNEVILEAKTKEEAIQKAATALNANTNEFVYHITEEKGKLFKNVNYKITAVTYTAIIKEITLFLENVVKNLGLHSEIIAKLNERKIDIQINSDNNNILIGKNGQTIKALEILTKQYISTKYMYHISLNIDIENYKEKRIKNLEHLAIKCAKEVVTTQIAATLENMNSYERRIVHNALTDFQGVTTISEGEEPNRHVIIKPIAK